jgi:hypothetical protein
MSSHTAHRTPTSRRELLSSLVLPVFFLVLLPLLYLWAFHSPTPRALPVDVVVTDSASGQLATGLQAQSGDALEVTSVDSLAAARADVRELDVRAAYDPSDGTLYVASSGSALATQVAEQLFTGVADESGMTLTVEDLAPLPADDSLGTGLMFITLGALLGGVMTSTVLRIAAPGQGLRTELGVLAGMSVVSAVIPMFLAYSVFGVLSGSPLLVGTLLATGAFVVGLAHLGLLRLIGPAAILLTMLVVVLLGLPASGAAIASELTPSFFGFLHHVLPTPALTEALRRALYFPDAGLGAQGVVLAFWALVGIALVGLSTLKRPLPAAPSPLGTPSIEDLDADPAERRRGNRKLLTGVLVVPLFFATIMPLVFLPAFGSPTPRGMDVAVIGNAAVAGPVVEGITAQSGDAFDVTRVADVDAAQELVRTEEIRGAYDPRTGTLYVAGAGGPQAGRAVEGLFTGVAAADDQTLEVEDLVPLDEDDPVGTSLLYIAMGAVLGGYLTSIVVSIALPGARTRTRLLTVLGMAVATTGVQLLFGSVLFDVLPGSAWTAAAVLFAVSLTTGLAGVGLLTAMGPAAVLLGLLLFMLLGVSASGIAVPTDMAPGFYQAVHSVLSTSSGMDLLRRALYFDGHGIAGDLITLGVTALVGLLLVAVGHRRQRSRESAAADAVVTVPAGGAEADTGSAAGSAADARTPALTASADSGTAQG